MLRLSERLDRLPVEDWAAGCARFGRRMMRRVMRRRAVVAMTVCLVGLCLVTGRNALFGQEASHPAPFWDAGSQAVPVAAVAPDPAPVDPLVRDIQARLVEVGAFDGPTTGELDPATVAAIERFEAMRGLPVQGEPSVALLAALMAAPDEANGAPRAVRTTRVVGPIDVRALQETMNARGYGPLTVDGKLGPNTRAALQRFADAEGLGDDPLSSAVARALGHSDA